MDLYYDIKMITRSIANRIIDKLPNVLMPVGSYRREELLINDLDFITTSGLTEIKKYIEEHFIVTKILRYGEKILRMMIMFENRQVKIDIWKTTNEAYPFALLAYTGPKNYVIGLRKKANELGFLLNDEGLFKGDEKVKIKTEKGIFEYLNIAYKLPKIRGKTPD